MKCPNCGAKSIKFMGQKEICLSCGYGSNVLMKFIDEPELRKEHRTYPSSKEIDPFVRAVNRFGFRMIGEVWQTHSKQNVVISPVALARSLCLLAEGTTGETRQSIYRALGMTDSIVQTLSAEVTRMQDSLSHLENGLDFSIKTALWPRRGLEFKQDFLDKDEVVYHAEWIEQNYADTQASIRLKDWLSRSGKARSLLQTINLDPMTTLQATASGAFRGGWQNPYRPADTTAASFSYSGGQQRKIPMMSQAGWFAYDRTDEFQIAGLPFGDGRIRLVVLLPDAGIIFSDMMKKLVYKRWEQWRTHLKINRGQLSIPRTLIESSLSLKPALSRLGMEIVFDELRANFEGMCAIPPMPDISLGDFWHSASLELTEAGAPDAQGISLELLLDAVQKPFKLALNSTFFFTLEDQETDSILLMGVVADPK